MEVLKIILKIFGVLTLSSIIIYWFNLDMKLIYKITPFMKKHYDTMERDHKL